jgi:plastocyanin
VDGVQQNHAAGIGMLAFIVAVAVSVGFYQFVYVPEAAKKPTFSWNIVEPEETTEITIVSGAANEGNGQFYVPDDKRVILGVSNRVVWHNADTVAHTVTSDDGYRDAYSGLFDSRQRPQAEGGPYIMPGTGFAFTFTRIGEYLYHCEPHPYMAGTIEVVEDFS